MQYGSDGAAAPDLARDLAASLLPTGPVGVERVRTVSRADLGDELADELTEIAMRFGDTVLGAPIPATRVELPAGVGLGVQVNPDGSTERFPFPLGDADGVTDVIKARIRGEHVTGGKAVQLAADLAVWIAAYDDEPTPDFLATLEPNLPGLFLVWMSRTGGIVPLFGPVLFTGTQAEDSTAFEGVTPPVLTLLERVGEVVSPDVAARFAPRLRELAAHGSYLQGAPRGRSLLEMLLASAGNDPRLLGALLDALVGDEPEGEDGPENRG